MDLEDGKKGRWSCRPERSSMKSLEKAVADYEKAKEKMEASRTRYEADLKREFLRRSAKCIALIDHTKFDSASISSYASIDDINMVITDDGISPTTVALYEDSGIEIL